MTSNCDEIRGESANNPPYENDEGEDNGFGQIVCRGQRINLLNYVVSDEDSDDYVVSEYESSCDSPASLDSDEDIGYSRSKKVIKMNNYKPTVDYKTLTFEIGMKFKDFHEAKEIIRNWAVVKGYNLKWKKSDGKKLEARCEGDCPFLLYASKLQHEETVVVKTMVDTHTCLRKSYNRQANSDWLAEIIRPVLKRHGNYSAKNIIFDVQENYGIIVNEGLCYVAKKKALEQLWGSYESHYSRLRPYVAHLQLMDREGTFLLKTYLNDDDQPVFQRVYMGFSCLRKGFLVGCRQCICFDACFIKNAIGGALLAAVARDCNGKMWPICWAVVEKEAEEPWTWFFTHVFEDLQINDGLGWTFMSDKHKGIINGIRKLAPLAEHRHCARHVYANWKKQFAGKKFKDMFWEAANATDQSTFNRTMEKLKALSMEGYEQFVEREPRRFCRALISPLTRTNTIENNICESFNSYILKFRDQPIIDMLEKIRKSLMSRMPEIVKGLEASSSVVCPDVIKKLGKLQRQVQGCEVLAACDRLFEVQTEKDNVKETWIVDLNAKKCSCRSWSLTGIPCCHGLACINYARDDPIRYVDEFYHRSNCLAAYKHFLSPLLGPQDWPAVDALPILPPPFIKPPGRPKKNRRRDVDEEPRQGKQKLSLKGIRIGCTRCKQVGHNVRTCRVPAPAHGETAQPLKRGVGRPKKPVTTTTTRIERKELAQARTGFGVIVGGSGNIYVRPPGARHTTLIRQQVNARQSSRIDATQSSQVIDGSTPPS